MRSLRGEPFSSDGFNIPNGVLMMESAYQARSAHSPSTRIRAGSSHVLNGVTAHISLSSQSMCSIHASERKSFPKDVLLMIIESYECGWIRMQHTMHHGLERLRLSTSDIELPNPRSTQSLQNSKCPSQNRAPSTTAGCAAAPVGTACSRQPFGVKS